MSILEHAKSVHIMPSNPETTQNRIRMALGKEPVYIPVEKQVRADVFLIFYFVNAAAFHTFFAYYELFGFSQLTRETPTWFYWALGITLVTLLLSKIDGKISTINTNVMLCFSIPFILYFAFYLGEY